MVSILPMVDLLGNTAVDWFCILSYFQLDTLPCSYIARLLHGPVVVREVWQLHTKKSPVTSFFGFVYLRSLEMLVFCFFSIETFAAALVRAFSSHCTFLIWWVGPTHIDKRRVYRLPVAMNVVCFIAFCGKLEYGQSRSIFAYISMTIWARGFKFAGTPVQRLQLALTQKSFSAQYVWFSRGGSHIPQQKIL